MGRKLVNEPVVVKSRYRALVAKSEHDGKLFVWYVFNDQQANEAMSSPMFVRWHSNWILQEFIINKAED